ncbi:coiled-coil domain-containing protein 93 [Leptopilina heterotoma]|uniref:coiled-coil domain-containing protein 93 n=1 Tax=Leptopilina heterotoma TaxID=63436 RepID=UPI001CA9A13B|nr:coiled-coil domain-containing protein 93 [Leptopilina heterotoma]
MFNDVVKKTAKSSEATEADVREDEEQGVKFQEIIDLLVAAGYFRARIKGLSNFDKVIGGLTWCIETCNFDIDVDLLFRENLTIGQKIALTEKIVAVLPKMNCPHRIEPHQIQGLDCIHIFPVVQWLVKRSMKTREQMAGFVRSFAVSQFEKTHSSVDDQKDPTLGKIENMIPNIMLVKKVYETRRPEGGTSTVQSSLLEYGAAAHIFTDTADGNDESQEQEMDVVDEAQSQISKVTDRYASLIISEDNASFRAIAALEKQKSTLENKAQKLRKERDSLLTKVSDASDRLKKIRSGRKAVEEAFKKMKEMETSENEETLRKLEELLSVHDGLKDQENKFRDQCRMDLNLLRNAVMEIEKGEPQKEEVRVIEYEEKKENVNRLRLQLAKKNRVIASLTRQLDDVPGRSELTQYQRRFMELYNQVSAKHKETKQYYTLYNTLDDTKLYLSKELSLLNSIQDNYNEAMASASGKEQFLKQFEAIVEGVKRNKSKVEKRCAEEKSRRDALSRQLVTLVEQQRKYVAAVKQLTIECRKNETLLAQLRGP